MLPQSLEGSWNFGQVAARALWGMLQPRSCLPHRPLHCTWGAGEKHAPWPGTASPAPYGSSHGRRLLERPLSCTAFLVLQEGNRHQGLDGVEATDVPPAPSLTGTRFWGLAPALKCSEKKPALAKAGEQFRPGSSEEEVGCPQHLLRSFRAKRPKRSRTVPAPSQNNRCCQPPLPQRAPRQAGGTPHGRPGLTPPPLRPGLRPGGGFGCGHFPQAAGPAPGPWAKEPLPQRWAAGCCCARRALAPRTAAPAAFETQAVAPAARCRARQFPRALRAPPSAAAASRLPAGPAARPSRR